jgi:hypothetical protein
VAVVYNAGVPDIDPEVAFSVNPPGKAVVPGVIE